MTVQNTPTVSEAPTQRPLNSRQYIEEAWEPCRILVDGDLMSCNFNANPELGGRAALCVIPTQALAVVEDPVRMKVKPNVMSEWLDRLTARGAGILLVHGKWFDNMWTSASMATRGVDYFSRIEARMAAAIDGALSRGWATPGRVVLMGSSRHAFVSLEVMARNSDVSAGVAHQPVVHWPRMREFQGMEGNPVVMRHSLYDLVDRFAPRPLYIQTGYADLRVGQDWIEALIAPLSAEYERRGCGPRFTRELLPIPGHDGTRVPVAALDSVVDWLCGQGLLEGGDGG